MDYFKLLQLKREPFSNSPDPDLFYHSKQHKGCLQKMELALRLRRGLNVIIGDIGTGKTTLCRELIRRFDADPQIQTHLILDPSFSSASACLKILFSMICKETQAFPETDMELKEAIKQRLFTDGVDEERTTVLIIDEGQKITTDCIEILRELLNYETNDYKLLQIVIFAQPELDEVLKAHANFADRINLLHYLAPMDFNDTRQMIYHRLKLSSKTPKPMAIFTFPALWAIYRFTKGYPRKIVHLCHQSVLTMIIQNRSKAGWSMIRSCKYRIGKEKRWVRRLLLFGGAVALSIAAAVVLVPYSNHFLSKENSAPIFKVPPEKSVVQAPATPHPVAETEEIPQVSPPAETTEVLVASPLPQQDQSVQPVPVPSTSAPEKDETFLQVAAVEKIEKPPATSTFKDPPAPPEMLGQLSVKPGDTLFDLVDTVYGRATNRNMRAVIEANQHIINPNAIDLGDVIYFPAIEHLPDISKRQRYWIVVEEQDKLEQALKRLYKLDRTMKVPLRLIANWSPSEGLVFWLAAKRYFSTPDDAIDYLSALPPEMISEGRIQAEWPDSAHIYSYLY